MKKKRALLPILLLLLLLSACSSDLPAMLGAGEPQTPTPLPTPTPAPTSTPVVEAAEGTGLAFYRAWEGFDYDGMYDLLSAQTRALVARDDFVSLYEEAMRTATVQTVHAQPMNALQEDDRAEMSVRVIWETALVGSISREHTMTLTYNQDRWGVVWDESLLLPELQGGQRLHMAYRAPARANIYDREGSALAYQGTAITLSVVPGEIQDEEGLLETLSPILRREPDELRQLYAEALPNWVVPLGNVLAEEAQEHSEDLEPYLGNALVAEQRLTRLYAQNGVAPHVTGYVGAIPAESLDDYLRQGYRGDGRACRRGGLGRAIPQRGAWR